MYSYGDRVRAVELYLLLDNHPGGLPAAHDSLVCRAKQRAELMERLALSLYQSKRCTSAVLTGARDLQAFARSWSATTHGMSSSTRLIAWSAMRASTKRRYASGSTSLSFAVPMRL
jgi:hypothetical protein